MNHKFNVSVYVMYTKIVFLNNLAYRSDYILGLFNTCIQLFIACLIWKTLYGDAGVVDGISLPMVITTIVIGQGLANAYQVNDQAVSKLIKDGSISFTLLRPISFRIQLLAEALGVVLFRLLSNFFPAVVIFSLTNDVLPPASMASFVLFVVSVTLGFGVLWMLSSIVQHLAFWVINIWSISTIKNVCITVLSGSVIPIWFLPTEVVSIIAYTPFDSIYFIPAQLYLGDILPADALPFVLKQIVWIAALLAVSHVLWVFGKKRVVIQGG